MNAILPPAMNAITAEKIIINGALITIRMHIMNAICTLCTSVVILVTKLEVVNLSILAKLNDSIFLYISLLKLVAKPTLALLPKTPPIMPQINETRAMDTKMMMSQKRLTLTFNPKLLFSYKKGTMISSGVAIFSIVSTNIDMTNGRAHSNAASKIMNIGVIIAGVLYCLRLFNINLIFASISVSSFHISNHFI